MTCGLPVALKYSLAACQYSESFGDLPFIRLQFVPKLQIALFAHFQVHFNLRIVSVYSKDKQIFLDAWVKGNKVNPLQ